MSYNAPVNALQFLLRYGVDMDQILAKPEYSDTNDELIGDILNGAAYLPVTLWHRQIGRATKTLPL